jgi:hypothetical protein
MIKVKDFIKVLSKDNFLFSISVLFLIMNIAGWIKCAVDNCKENANIQFFLVSIFMLLMYILMRYIFELVMLLLKKK